MLPAVKKSLLLSSHIKIYKNICLEPFWTIFTCKRCLICAYFSPDSDETTFSLREALLWIIDYFGRSSWWICFSQTCSFSLHKMLIDGLESWITYGLLWCFYQLFGLSFWRHPFTAEDSLVSKWCNATFFQKKQTHVLFGWPEGE